MTGATRTFEDFASGDVFDLGTIIVDADEALAFAMQFDPQPMHVDAATAESGLFGHLSISGWQTCALWMRMFHDTVLAGSSSQGGPGMDAIRWLKPVRPGARLSGTATVTEIRPSRSRPTIGLVSFAQRLSDETGEPVMTAEHTVMFARKAALP